MTPEPDTPSDHDALLERMADLEQRVLFLESAVKRIDADRQALRAELQSDHREAPHDHA